MRKFLLLTFFFLFICSISLFAQKEPRSILNRDALLQYPFKSKNFKKHEFKVPKDTVGYILNHTNYCLFKFQQENRIAIGAEILGASLIAFGNLNSINGTDKAIDKYNKDIAYAGSNLEQRAIAEVAYNEKLRDIDKKRDILTISGGIIILGGGVLHLVSYRWLKRAYLVPIDNGIAAGIKFKF